MQYLKILLTNARVRLALIGAGPRFRPTPFEIRASGAWASAFVISSALRFFQAARWELIMHLSAYALDAFLWALAWPSRYSSHSLPNVTASRFAFFSAAGSPPALPSRRKPR